MGVRDRTISARRGTIAPGPLWPGTSAEQVRRRVVEQHEAGANRPEKIRGWYNLVGGGACFLLVDTDDAAEVTDLLQAYMELVSWEVHGIYELPWDETIKQFKETSAD